MHTDKFSHGFLMSWKKKKKNLDVVIQQFLGVWIEFSGIFFVFSCSESGVEWSNCPTLELLEEK